MSVPPQTSHTPGFAGRAGLVVIDLAAIAAGEAPGDPRDQRLVIDLHLDHRIQRLPQPRQQRASASACASVRGKPSKMKPPDAPGQLFLDQPDHDLVGDQLAAVHHLGHARPISVPLMSRRAQHVAGGKLHHAALLDQPRPGCPCPPPAAREE
jgi:hypothetical protein